ncbi:hypothetical protein JCM8547_001169 [Rhodosporidiobolus lusitaniae]
MLMPLTALDKACESMSILSFFVFELPPSLSLDERVHLVGQVKDAAQRVADKWKLLSGKPEWTKAGVWAIRIDETPDPTRPSVGFSSAGHSEPFHLAAGLSAPLPPLSSAPTALFPSAPNLSLFRPAHLPTTLAAYAKQNAPFVHVHAALFSDSLAVGISFSHGVFDGEGAGFFNRALSAELHGREWVVPPLPEDGKNPFVAKLEALEADEEVAAKARENPSPGFEESWALMSVRGALRLVVDLLWEKVRWKNAPGQAFLSDEAVARLVSGVKEEVKRETAGREYVSTGDILTGWILQSIHADDVSSGDCVISTAVYNSRELLDKHFPDTPSLSTYSATCAVPYMHIAKPLPISTLLSTPLSALSLSFRRNLKQYRTLPALSSLSKLIRGSSVLIPVRGLPQLPPFLRTLLMPWTLLPAWRKPHIHRYFFSNQLSLPLAEFSVPNPLGDEGKDDLPMTYFLQGATVPISPSHLVAFQKVQGGIAISGIMRKGHWEALGRGIEKLNVEVV